MTLFGVDSKIRNSKMLLRTLFFFRIFLITNSPRRVESKNFNTFALKLC